jgi:hypothetical protein
MVGALAFGSAAAWLALCAGPNVADNQAIQQVVSNVPFERAQFACTEASGVCSTLYSQVCPPLGMPAAETADLQCLQRQRQSNK